MRGIGFERTNRRVNRGAIELLKGETEGGISRNGKVKRISEKCDEQVFMLR